MHEHRKEVNRKMCRSRFTIGRTLQTRIFEHVRAREVRSSSLKKTSMFELKTKVSYMYDAHSFENNVLSFFLRVRSAGGEFISH